MFRKFAGLVFAASLWAGASIAAPQVAVQLSKSSDSHKAEASYINIDVTNTGSVTVYVFPTELPVVGDAPVLLSNVFEVKNADGQVATYRGAYAKRIVSPDDFIKLAPGAKLHYEVDVGANYNVTSGEGTVGYRRLSFYDRPQDSSSDMKPLGLATSNSIKVWFNPALIDGSRATHASVSPSTVTGCGANAGAVTAAYSAAKQLATNAIQYIGAHTTPIAGDPDGNTVFTPSARSIYWLGQSEPVQSNDGVDGRPGHYSYVRIIDTYFGTANGMPKFTCGCPTGTSPSVAAVAEANFTVVGADYSNAEIKLCPKFFTLPLSGTDSQAGTIIHEMTHFAISYTWSPSVTYVEEGTGDYLDGSTYSSAHQVALNNPTEAVRNANNYQYFFENIPAKN